MARIRNTLREGLEGLLATSEVFFNFSFYGYIHLPYVFILKQTD